MIVSTINVNGIRAAVKQRSETTSGLLAWLAETTADVVCLQETRADDEQLAAALAPALADGWHLASADPHLKGRNGVAILSAPAIRGGADRGVQTNSRCTAATWRRTSRDLTVASVYIQTGEADTDRQLEKERFMAAVATRMAAAGGRRPRRGGVRRLEHRAHRERHQDLEGQRQEVRVPAAASGSGSPTCSTPAGSTWCASCTPTWPGPYSWWSWRGRAFDNDAGWRIDYQLATPDLAARASAARVERAAAYALRWSDHAPVTVEYLAAARS